MGNCSCCKFGHILILVGGVNWGLIGIGDFVGKDLNVVNMILGSVPTIESVVYVLIGLVTVCKALKMCKKCQS